MKARSIFGRLQLRARSGIASNIRRHLDIGGTGSLELSILELTREDPNSVIRTELSNASGGGDALHWDRRLTPLLGIRVL